MPALSEVSNKRSHHVGVSVGVDKADFPTLGVMTGGNNALAIIANRFSFVFNLKGPNYICDTARVSGSSERRAPHNSALLRPAPLP